MRTMDKKPTPAGASRKSPEIGRLDRQVQVSESGQVSVSIDAVRQLPSFLRDVHNVARIREMLAKR